MITKVRAQLRAAALRGPEAARKPIAVLDKQLRNFAKSNAEERAVLRPEIEKSVARIEAACAGR